MSVSDDIHDDDVAAVTYDQDDDSVVVIIGSGASGGTLAYELAKQGIDVVCLEAGRRLKVTDFVNDEHAAYDMFTWTDKRTVTGNAAVAKAYPNAPTWVCKLVGGSTVHWGGLALRWQEHEFKPHSVYGDIAGANLIDWPISLSDLEPYYARAEANMGVSGTNGLPESPKNNNYKVIAHGARQAGYSKVSNNNWAINPVPYDGRNACDQIGFCFQGCRSGAKWSTLYVEVPKAEATGHFELRAECMALQVQHDPSGKVSGVLYVDRDGNQHFQKARVVSLACNAVETARLMLNSASNTFPDGLANSSGELGRNYIRHVTALVYGVFDKRVNWHRGMVGQTVVQDEWLHDEKRGFASGYVMIGFALGLPYYAAFMDPGAWGRSFADKVETYNHVSGIAMTGEDMPLATNAVTLHPTERDQYGLAIPNLHIDDHENDIKLRNHGVKACTRLYEAAGATRVIDTPPMPGSHNMGTARMSARPGAGVVNGWGQSHDIANLFVADGSIFASAAGVNPTLTIVTLAIRQADYIAEAMRKGEL
jgi:choline dehydrogenase-like flavoprotein